MSAAKCHYKASLFSDDHYTDRWYQ